MAKYVLIGSSDAFVKVIAQIKLLDQSSEIVLITSDGNYPCKYEAFLNCLLTSDFSSYMTESLEFYKKNNVEVVIDQNVNRISVSRKKVTLEDKRSFDFDYLIISDSNKYKFNEIKGINKTGLFGFKKLKDVRDIGKELLYVDTVVINSNDVLSLGLAKVLIERKKEVFLISNNKCLLNFIEDEEIIEWFNKNIENNSIRFIGENSISEILGDSDLKAVRLHSGKVIGCEMVIDFDAPLDLRMYSDLDQVDNLLNVDSDLKTSVDGIFAVDHLCDLKNLFRCIYEFESINIVNSQVQEISAENIVSSIFQKERVESRDPWVANFALKDLAVSLISKNVISNSEYNNLQGIRSNIDFNQDENTLRANFICGNQLLGCVLINCSNDDLSKAIDQIKENQVFLTENDDKIENENIEEVTLDQDPN